MSSLNIKLYNNYTTQNNADFPCSKITKKLPYEIFNINKSLLPDIMFEQNTGRLRDDATRAIANLGFIESIIVKDKLVNRTVSIKLKSECKEINSLATLRQLDLIITIGYSIVLLNPYHNANSLNSNQVLGFTSNFTTIKSDGFMYLSPEEDFTKYTLAENYKLNFVLKSEQDKYAPSDLPIIGVVTEGSVYGIYIGP